MKIICFDIGGTKILKAVVKLRGGKFDFLEIEEEKNPRKEDKIKNIILAYCQKTRKRYWTKKIAFSAAHIVDLEKKMINGGKWCYGTASFDLKFFEKNGFSVRAENDGRCFAAGEYFFGKGKEAESLFSLALGTNIGGGFIIDGRNFRGSHQSAMEISFLNIFHGSRWYDWDDFSAGNGIERLYKNKVGRKLSSQDIFQKAENKNKDAEEVIKQAAEFLGIGVANLINILDPDIIVFGGSVSKQKKYIEKAVAIAKKNVMNKKANYKFAISSLGNKANLLGAAMLYK